MYTAKNELWHSRSVSIQIFVSKTIHTHLEIEQTNNKHDRKSWVHVSDIRHTWRTGCLKIDYAMRRIQTSQRRLTHWYEWLRGRTVARHADAVDGIDSHLVRHPFDHPLGFIGGVRVRVKVQPHPPVALRLLSLQHVTWEARCEEAMLLLPNEPGERKRLLVLLFTDNWLSAVKLRRLPLDNTGVLPHTQDFNCLWRIWDIWWWWGE